MAEELLSLKWNNHQSHFVDILSFLREKDMFVDATIACGGKVYSAHKFVLSTCSDYFKEIFTHNSSSNPIVFMKDVSCRDIEALLDFMYHGEVNVPQSSLGSLIKTAEGLQIKGLAVPDDPPASKREQERDKRERDSSSSSHLENRSPPPKRRIRERCSPSRRSSNHQTSTVTPQTLVSKAPSSTGLNSSYSDIATQDEQATSRIRSTSPATSLDGNSHGTGKNNDTRHSQDEDRGESREALGEDSNSVSAAHLDPPHPPTHSPDVTPGPSGLSHSKHEEVEIKQEDVVDLGEEEEEGDWGGGGLGDIVGDEGGTGNDSLSSADNTVNFSEVMLPHADGSGAVGDSAMLMCSGDASTISSIVSPLTPAGGDVWGAVHSSPNDLHLLNTTTTAFLFDTLQSVSGGGHRQYLFNTSMASNRQRTKQNEVRDGLAAVHEEIAVLQSLLDTAKDEDHFNIQNKLHVKRMEQVAMEKGLQRLISGQMRQRKFREKLKLKSHSENE